MNWSSDSNLQQTLQAFLKEYGELLQLVFAVPGYSEEEEVSSGADGKRVLAVSPTSTYTKGNNLFAYLTAMRDVKGEPVGLNAFKLMDDGKPAFMIFVPDGPKGAQNDGAVVHTQTWEQYDGSQYVRNSGVSAQSYAEAIIGGARTVNNPNAWADRLVKGFGKKLTSYLKEHKSELTSNHGLLGKGYEAEITKDDFDGTIKRFVTEYLKAAFIRFKDMAKEPDFQGKLEAVVQQFLDDAAKPAATDNLHTGIMKTVNARYEAELGKGKFKAGSKDALAFRERNIRYLLLEHYAMQHKLLDFQALHYAGQITDMLIASIEKAGKKVGSYWSQLDLKVESDRLKLSLRTLYDSVNNCQPGFEVIRNELAGCDSKRLMAAALANPGLAHEELATKQADLVRLLSNIQGKRDAIADSAEYLRAFFEHRDPDEKFVKQFPIKLTLAPSAAKPKPKLKICHLHDFMEWYVTLGFLVPEYVNLCGVFSTDYNKFISDVSGKSPAPVRSGAVSAPSFVELSGEEARQLSPSRVHAPVQLGDGQQLPTLFLLAGSRLCPHQQRGNDGVDKNKMLETLNGAVQKGFHGRDLEMLIELMKMMLSHQGGHSRESAPPEFSDYTGHQTFFGKEPPAGCGNGVDQLANQILSSSSDEDDVRTGSNSESSSSASTPPPPEAPEAPEASAVVGSFGSTYV